MKLFMCVVGTKMQVKFEDGCGMTTVSNPNPNANPSCITIRTCGVCMSRHVHATVCYASCDHTVAAGVIQAQPDSAILV